MNECAAWINSVGLVADLAGAWIVGFSVITGAPLLRLAELPDLPPAKKIEATFDGIGDTVQRELTAHHDGIKKTIDAQRKYVDVINSDRRDASTKSIIGGVLFTLGVVLQVVATWMPASN